MAARIFASGRRRRATVALRGEHPNGRRGRCETRSARPTATIRRSCPRRGPAIATGTASTAATARRSRVAFSARGAVRTVRRSSTRGASAGRDSTWSGIRLRGQVLYEMHVGTFTAGGHVAERDGEAAAARRAGHHHRRSHAGGGVPGPVRLGLRRRVPVRADAAVRHSRRSPRVRRPRARPSASASSSTSSTTTWVPTARVFSRFAKSYFTKKYDNEWGDALNFDGPDSAPVREYFAWNGAYWIDEFHLDGLRLDATQSIHDRSPEHIIAAISTRRAGGRAAALDRHGRPRTSRRTSRMLRRVEDGGYGLDAAWNDDFHHSASVALTGRTRGLLRRSPGRAAGIRVGGEIRLSLPGAAVRLAEAEPRHRRARRSQPAAFVNFIENHDQLANSGDGSRMRLRTAPGPVPRDDGAAAADARHAHAVPGAGVRRDHAVSLLCGSQARAGRGGGEGARRVHGAVPEPGVAADARSRARAARPGDVRAEHAAIGTSASAHVRGPASSRGPARAATDGSRVLAAGSLARWTAPSSRADAFVLRYATRDAGDERLLVVNLGRDLVAVVLRGAAPRASARICVARRGGRAKHREYGGSGTPDVVHARMAATGPCGPCLETGAERCRSSSWLKANSFGGSRWEPTEEGRRR